MKSELYQLFKELNLSPSQSQICYYLISMPLTVKDLILKTGLARSTLVESLVELEKIGIIKANYQEKKKIYSLIDSHVFENLIDSKISELGNIQQQLFESKDKISKFIKLSASNPSGFDNRIELFLGKKEIANLYRSTVKEESIFSICRLDDYYSLFPGGLLLQSRANHLKKKRNFKDLIIEGSSLASLEQNKTILDYNNYKSKIIKDSEFLRQTGFSDIMICKDYIIFSNFKSLPPYSYKLNSEDIANFMKYFHTLLWDSL